MPVARRPALLPTCCSCAQGKSVVCAEIIRGDGMVPLDLSAAIGLGGIDPYVQLQFGNNEPVKSSYISGSREPVWQQQLEAPKSPLYLPFISPPSPSISPRSPPDLPVWQQQLEAPQISTISPLHLPYISP